LGWTGKHPRTRLRGNHSFHQTHPAHLNTKTFPGTSGQEGSSIHHYVRSLSTSTWPYATPFVELNQPSLKRTTRYVSTRSTRSFTKTHKTPKPNPVWSQALLWKWLVGVDRCLGGGGPHTINTQRQNLTLFS